MNDDGPLYPRPAHEAAAAGNDAELRPAAGQVNSLPGRARFPSRLSPRKRQVLVLALNGLTDRQIAERLDLRLSTVRVYLYDIRMRLDPATRAQLFQARAPRPSIPRQARDPAGDGRDAAQVPLSVQDRARALADQSHRTLRRARVVRDNSSDLRSRCQATRGTSRQLTAAFLARRTKDG